MKSSWERKQIREAGQRGRAHEASAAVPIRRQHVPGCTYCDRFQPTEMFPPHDASDRCESGKHNHCTCDTCF